MGCCGSKQDALGAYGEGAPSRAAQAAPPPRAPPQMRKGSIAAFNENAQELQKQTQKTWDKTRRQPVRGESFKPERQAQGRRASVVCVLKDDGDEDFICSCLGDHPLFSHLGRSQVAEIASVMVSVGYPKGACVYHSWEHGDAFFLIRKGRVKFSQSEADAAPLIPGVSPGRKMSVNMAALGPSAGLESDRINTQPIMGATDADKASLADGGDMELGEGSAFGELAGVWSSRRGFTATTLDDCEMFTIDREALRRSITQGFATRRAAVCTRFAKVKLFAEMEKVASVKLDLLSLADSMTESTHKENDVLCSSGQAMDTFFLITKGEVDLQIDGVEGETTLSRSDCLGEAGLVCGGLQWSVTAKCLGEVVVQSISRSLFQTKFGSTAGDLGPAVPSLSGSTIEEREGYHIAAADAEVPEPLQGRKYSEFQRAKLAIKGGPRAKHDTAGLADSAAAEQVESPKAPNELDTKSKLKNTDFEWHVELNGGSERESRERLVGSAYWAGHEGWRAGVRVYMCTLKNGDGATYAVRVYDKAALWHGNGLNEARDELNIIKELSHPRLLKLLNVFMDERLIFYVMPMIVGTTVGALMQEQRFKYIPESWAKHYAVQTISAIKYLHCKGLVHRNIYPDSMLLDSDGWIVLGGTMFMRKPRPNARLWTVCGVPDYLSPEVLQGFGHSRMSDVWSLGVLVHEMCTNKVPFDG
jgi:CRP-like cAMP-binding protein